MGFRRSLQVQLLSEGFQGSLQKFAIYDRKSLKPLKSAEGFQNPSDIPDILNETAIESRIVAEPVKDIDRSTYVPKTILGISTAPTARISAPIGSCTFTPKPVAVSGFQYKEEYKYNEVFANAVPFGSPLQKNSLKECYDACSTTQGCVGMNYKSDTGICRFYGSINSADMTSEPNSVSIVMPGQDKTLEDMRSKVRAAIISYKAIREAIQNSASSKTNFRDSTRYIGRDLITDTQVEKDLAAIASMNSVECLNAFLEKYTLTTK